VVYPHAISEVRLSCRGGRGYSVCCDARQRRHNVGSSRWAATRVRSHTLRFLRNQYLLWRTRAEDSLHHLLSARPVGRDAVAPTRPGTCVLKSLLRVDKSHAPCRDTGVPSPPDSPPLSGS